MSKILIVDDDPHILDVVAFTLEKAGHSVIRASDGDHALLHVRSSRPDLMVLDVGLPGQSGLDICRTIKSDPLIAEMPILFLSARDEEIDRVLGLEMGADDYVVKPFSPRELTARVTAVLRRTASNGPAPVQPSSHGALEVDFAAARTRFNGTEITLTAQELSILKVLLSRPGQVFPRHQIVELGYEGNIHVSDRTVDSHIRNVRAKFAEIGGTDIIQTVPRLGFRLGPCTISQDAP